jgi:hypothetical protein
MRTVSNWSVDGTRALFRSRVRRYRERCAGSIFEPLEPCPDKIRRLRETHGVGLVGDIDAGVELGNGRHVEVAWGNRSVPLTTSGTLRLHAVSIEGARLTVLCDTHIEGNLITWGTYWADEHPIHVARCAACAALFPLS